MRRKKGGSGSLADVLPGALELEIPALVRSGKDADAEGYRARCLPVLGGVTGESVRRVDLLNCFAAMDICLGIRRDFFDVPGCLVAWSGC